jgi:hypothetical protein
VYTVSIQDTAELLSMNGVLSGVNIKPEFFRSERQIIIDAEQLLKDKDSISVEKFNARSNDLGVSTKNCCACVTVNFWARKAKSMVRPIMTQPTRQILAMPKRY